MFSAKKKGKKLFSFYLVSNYCYFNLVSIHGEIGVHLFRGVWSPSCASFALRRVAPDH